MSPLMPGDGSDLEAITSAVEPHCGKTLEKPPRQWSKPATQSTHEGLGANDATPCPPTWTEFLLGTVISPASRRRQLKTNLPHSCKKLAPRSGVM